MLSTRGQKLFYGIQDSVAIGYSAEDEVFPVLLDVDQMFIEFAAAVRTFHLAIAKQIDMRQQMFVQDFKAMWNVISPVVAVGKMKSVDVPLVGRGSDS